MDLIENDMDLISNDIDGLDEEYDEDTDYDDLFVSPTLTDIESDLDLLDKSGHEFPPYDGTTIRLVAYYMWRWWRPLSTMKEMSVMT